MSAGVRQALLLAAVAVTAVLALTVMDRLTREPIAHSLELAADAALRDLVPTLATDPNLVVDAVAIPPQHWLGLGLSAPERARRLWRGGRVLAVLVPTVAAHGYGGPIRLLVGIDRDGVVTGVQVVAERETPGVGDRIRANRSDWIRAFAGASRERPPAADWRVRKEGGAFDAIAGATISSRAVIGQVRRALDYFHDDREQLLNAAGDTSTEAT
ncbi:MAG: RnfABCDGE type electron transport complex subunit G, partial [Pseudomonadales bacterium]|nr:RnfABCDGE type electron transport complex subunit G [Pseudomonadales bacterium]